MRTYTTKQIFLIGLFSPLVLALLVGGSVMALNAIGKGGNEERILGNKDAKIKIVEYSDFQCPFCGRLYPTVKQLLANYGDKISFEYKHFPLDFHPQAQKAAEAAECAGEQGKFWSMHDKLFENQQNLSLANFKQWAKDLDLNTSKFNSCLDSGKFAAKVQADYQEGSTKGVDGTPATFINGQAVIGAQPYQAFQQVIDTLLKS